MRAKGSVLSLSLLALSICAGCTRALAAQEGKTPLPRASDLSRSHENKPPAQAAPPPASLIFELHTTPGGSPEGDTIDETIVTEVRARPGDGIGEPGDRDQPFSLVEIVDRHHAKVRVNNSLVYGDRDRPKHPDAEPVLVSLKKLEAWMQVTCEAGPRYTLRILDTDHLPSVRADGPEVIAAIRRHAKLNLDQVGSVQGVEAGLEFSAEDMREVGKLNNLRWLTIPSAMIGDADMVHLKGLSRLFRLNLAGTSITDAALPAIAKLPRVEWLDLSRTKVTDKGLPLLVPMKRLEILSVPVAGVTEDGVWAFLLKQPDCLVPNRGWGRLVRRGEAVNPIQLVQRGLREDSPIVKLLRMRPSCAKTSKVRSSRQKSHPISLAGICEPP